MRVAILPLLLGCLIVGGAAPAAGPAGHPGAGGVMPVPGMGPPGAVAGYGSLPIPARYHPPGAQPVPAPLVAAKFLAPKGVRVTAFPGSNLARMYDTPALVGLRPGYVYRFELTNLPYNPGKALYPEVEVRGTLVPRPGMKYMDYPIPLTFTPMDIERALGGALITKVVYLEDPEKAIPVEVSPDNPVETPEDTEAAAMKAAHENGRLMAIVRLGDRKPSAAELQTVAIEGTILLPGEKQLKGPALPPVFPFWGVPLFDPILGPRGPKEECFLNGDDKDAALGFGRDGRLGGLNPTDVGVEYSVGGKRKVTTSCVVCICAPRYMIRRVEVAPGGFEHRQYLAEYRERTTLAAIRERIAPMAFIGREKANELVGRIRPSAYVGQVGLSFFIGTDRPIAIAQVEGVKVTGALVEPEQLTAYPTLCPLTVTKVIDPPGPKQSGDVVTVTIRYANTGSKPASDLVVSDSLSGRLEYVPGSAQSDRPSNFTVAENEVGSVLLRWELPGVLLPGQAGTIKFKAKVR
jgi:uncharacterized repeat protein (TIGR01451 family)